MLFSQLGLAGENSLEPDRILGMGNYLLTRESGLRPQIFFFQNEYTHMPCCESYGPDVVVLKIVCFRIFK